MWEFCENSFLLIPRKLNSFILSMRSPGNSFVFLLMFGVGKRNWRKPAWSICFVLQGIEAMQGPKLSGALSVLAEWLWCGSNRDVDLGNNSCICQQTPVCRALQLPQTHGWG